MTIENCIRLLRIYKGQGENGATALIRSKGKKAYENMVAHIRKCRKFAGHDIMRELPGGAGVKDVKKSKG